MWQAHIIIPPSLPPPKKNSHTMDKFVPASSIEGFYVISYQSKFASHHTRDCHVDFLFTRSSIGEYNKMSRYFLFSSYHNTKLQLNDNKY